MSAVRLMSCARCLCFVAIHISCAKAEVQFLDQHWNDATRQLFYTTSQGSRMIPYDWFLALEVSDGQESFLRARVPKLGYLPNTNTLANPDSLPVGFVLDTDWSGRRYLGLSCAACHTNQIRFKQTTYQIDGAPTLADMWGLVIGLQESLNATATQESKFARFARQVLGDAATSNEMAELRNDLNDFRARWNQFVADSTADPSGRLSWGHARLDAFGMIFNRVSSIDLDLPANSSHPNAPVSYPYLWGTSWEDRVQWNASAPNRNDIERLGRNVGEVLGVFAAADLQNASILRPYYRTSARRLNQLRMENWLKQLWSPSWPKEFPPIDSDKKKAGAQLFNKYCVQCHQVVEHGKQDTPVNVPRIPVGDVGTDSRMALNAIQRMVATGRLEGSRIPPGFEPLPATMSAGTLLVNVVEGAVVSPFHDVDTRHRLLSLKSIVREANNGSMELTHEEIQEFLRGASISSEADLASKLADYRKFVDDYNRQLTEFVTKAAQVGPQSVQMETNPYVYKARPLDGIWATAPYLHNGSVPNLYELLLPAEQRTKAFYVGNMEYDPVNVGFVTTAGDGLSKVDTQIDGNRNTGHDQYGNRDLTPEQRMQLLEYLKSL